MGTNEMCLRGAWVGLKGWPLPMGLRVEREEK